MWPKQNFETGFGDWRNRSSGVGWGNRNMGGASRNWKSWQGGNRSSQASYQKKAKAKPTPKKPTKRTLSKTGTKSKAVANKRQKVVKYSQIPLTKVMLVNPGNKEGELPELVFGGFYDCVREAKIGKPRHLLQIEATNKSEKKKRGSDSSQADWKVSIPVPTTSVEAVSIISGTNPFEKLLKAHSDRISLNNSIEHWNKVIRGRTAALQKKEEELESLQEIEEEVEEAPEPKNEEVAKTEEEEAAKEADADDKTESKTKESDSQTKDKSADSEDDEEDADLTEMKIKESKEEIEKRKKKERETRIRKRKFVTSVIKKLTSAVEKGKQSLALEQTKLDNISDEWGEQLAYFQNEITDDEALSYFKQQLKEEIQSMEKEDSDGDKENADDNDQEDEEMEADTEKSKDTEDDTGDVEMAEAEDKTEGETEKAESKEKDSAVEVKKVESPKKKNSGKVTEIPVWLILSLKKNLERATVSADAPVSTEDHIKKASMIIMKLHPKHKKTIVLKGVTYQGSEEYLKVLNEVLEGPWKAFRKDPKELMKSKTPYSHMGTLKYLVMCQTRCEVLDNIIENCKLCEKPLKHSAMELHLRDICPMREEECEFCSAVFAASALEEHQESECTQYPISCPAKCSKKFARAEEEEHKKVCVNAVVDCEFESFGCNKQIKRKELSRHLKISVFEHLELVKGRVTILTEYMMKNDPALKDIIKPTDAEPESE